jgi:hypothetical protein
MRIIFVGIHNKQGLQPLDSSSQSGKRIDNVIKNFPSYECLKTNLFDSDHIPRVTELRDWFIDYYNRVGIREDDILVCLGSTVWEYFKNEDLRLVKFYHPSPLNRAIKGINYVETLTKLLNSVMNDERIATQQTSNQGGNAGINK